MDDTTLIRLLAVGRSLLSQLDLDAMLEQLLDVARELTGAQYAAVGIMDRGGAELERFVTSGIDEQGRAAIGPLPRGHGVLGVLIADPRPLRLDDVGAHPRSYGFPVNHPPMRSFLGVPILVRGEAWGNLYLTEKPEGGVFTEADEEAMVVLADWAANRDQRASARFPTVSVLECDQPPPATAARGRQDPRLGPTRSRAGPGRRTHR